MWIALIVILAILCVLFIIPTGFLFIASLFISRKKEYDTDSPFYRKLLYRGTDAMLWPLRIHVNFTGKEKIPKTKRVFFVYNHVSNFDPILLYTELKDWNISFLSKEENFHVPVFGRFARRCLFLAIDREAPKEALKAINKAADFVKREEVSFGASPEGTRSKTGVLLPFHDGVFKVAKKANAYVVVVCISDTEKIQEHLLFHRHEVRYDIADVITPEEVAKENVHTIAKRAWDAIYKITGK